MKLPSIHYLVNSAKKSFLRFPLSIISACIAVILALYMMENENKIKNFFPFVNVLITSALGISLYFSASIFSERKKLDSKKKWLLSLLVTVLLLLIYWSLPGKDSTHNTAMPYIKFAVYAVTSHLLAAFIPYLSKGELNGFWQYNKSLFIRILLSGVFSNVLTLGLILALAALNLLFDIHIPGKLYMEINICVIGIFNTWFFLSGIPEDFDELEQSHNYPRELKVFAQYILLSLLALYLVILYAYAGKILLSWDWPRGIVSWLVICVAILGSLTFLLLYPYGKQEGNGWIDKVSKIFFVLLVPLIVMLFIAVLMRIDDYGITIKRYVVLFLGVWLSIVCVFTITGRPNIRFIPLSLAILMLLMSFGPWGMFSVSESWQVKRLKAILEKSNILVNGKIQNEQNYIYPLNSDSLKFKNDTLLSDSLHNEVKSIVDYLDDFHGFSSIRGWYRQNLDSLIDAEMKRTGSRHLNEAEAYMEAMGLRFEERYSEDDGDETSYFTYSLEGYQQGITKVTGYDFYGEFNSYISSDDPNELITFTIDTVEYNMICIQKGMSAVSFSIENGKNKNVIPLDSMVNRMTGLYGKSNRSLPEKEMVLHARVDNWDMDILFNSIEMKSIKGKGSRLQNLSGKLLIRKR